MQYCVLTRLQMCQKILTFLLFLKLENVLAVLLVIHHIVLNLNISKLFIHACPRLDIF